MSIFSLILSSYKMSDKVLQVPKVAISKRFTVNQEGTLVGAQSLF